jgi:hypothetical protein
VVSLTATQGKDMAKKKTRDVKKIMITVLAMVIIIISILSITYYSIKQGYKAGLIMGSVSGYEKGYDAGFSNGIVFGINNGYYVGKVNMSSGYFTATYTNITGSKIPIYINANGTIQER